MEILNEVSKISENVSRIENRLFNVIDYKVPTPTPAELGLPVNTDVVDCPTQVIYNNRGTYLGEVKSSYESIQPKEFFETVLGSVAEYGDGLDLGRMTYEEFRNERVVNFKIPTEMVVFRNRVGKTEEVELFVNFETGFGGLKSTNIGLFSKRFICSNGMRIVNSELQLTARHTKRNNAKVLLWTRELGRIIEKQLQVGQLWKQLDGIDISKEQINKFLHSVVNLPKEITVQNALSGNGSIPTRTLNILTSLQESLDVEFSRTGKSAYGLIQGVTHYTNHIASGAGNEYVNVANGLRLNNQVQKFAMAMK